MSIMAENIEKLGLLPKAPPRRAPDVKAWHPTLTCGYTASLDTWDTFSALTGASGAMPALGPILGQNLPSSWHRHPSKQRPPHPFSVHWDVRGHLRLGLNPALPTGIPILKRRRNSQCPALPHRRKGWWPLFLSRHHRPAQICPLLGC